METLRLLARDHCDGMRPAPENLLSPRRAVDVLKRSMRLQPSLGVTPSLIMSPEATSSVHPDKAGRPGAGLFLSWLVREVVART